MTKANGGGEGKAGGRGAIPLQEAKLLAKKAKAGGRAAIEGTQPAKASPAPAAAPEYLAERFEMRDNGLFKRGGDENHIWVSGPFAIEAETRDDEGRGWGLLLTWRDRDGVAHEEAFSRALFAGDCMEIRSRLADAGLSLNAFPPARQALAEYLNASGVQRRARSVPRIGWHHMGTSPVFVLPGAVFGDAAERVVLQTETRELSLFNQAGTLDAWRADVAIPCAGNSRLVFALSCAFAGPLLGVLEEDGGGFNLRGASRVGKSTALHVAASVWGGAPGVGAGGFIRQWRATANGIEGIAAAHSDALLPLDEMGQVDARECGEVAYMLANGQGKARAGRSGLARPALRFRVLFLSTGEVGLADKNAEAGRATKAGQEVRLADVPADAGAGCGLFEELHGAESARTFADELRQATGQQYGTAAPVFLAFVTDRLRRNPEWKVTLRANADELIRAWLALWPDANGQVSSVARRFALVALAGELAGKAGLTGWGVGVATEAAHTCFRAWLSERGTSGSREDEQAVVQLRSFIGANGPSRFELWKDVAVSDAAQGDLDGMPPAEGFRTVKRAGWRRWVRDADGRHGWRYFLTPDGWGEAMDGLDKRAAGKLLAGRGFLLASQDGRNSRLVTPPGHRKVRAYEVLGDIMGAADGNT